MKLKAVSFALGSSKIDISEKYNDPRLLEKTGIRSVYQEHESTQELIKKATKKLAKDHLETIKACILVTQSPDDFLPANAIPISAHIGLSKDIMAFDVNQGCSGFVQALIIANGLLASYNEILLLTGDRYRSKLRASDRSTNSVFSDGSSASIWVRDPDRSLIYQKHLTDGSKRDWLFQCTGSKSSELHMSGAEIWMFTKSKVVPMILDAVNFVEEKRLNVGNIFLHQASKIVVEGICAALPLTLQSRVPQNYYKYGNTVSSTIPILIAETGISNERETVDIFCGFGVGLSCSIAILGSIH